MIQQFVLRSGIRDGSFKELLPYYLIAVSYMLVLFSYPMPPAPGGVEVLMGAGLVVGCILMLRTLGKLEGGGSKWLAISMVAGGILVIYPSIHALSTGLEFRKVARDLFPMIFLVILVPLIAYSTSRDIREKVAGVLLAAVLCVGAISPVEFIIDMRTEYGSMSGLSAAFDSTYSTPENIQVPKIQAQVTTQAPVAAQAQSATPTQSATPAQSVTPAQSATPAPVQNTFSVRALHMFEPAVIFAAIYCGCFFFVAISRRRLIEAGTYAAVVGVAFYGLSTLRLRAPVGLFVIALLVFIAYFAIKSNNRKRQFEIVVLATLACVIGGLVFKDAIAGLILKQHLVGTNGKLEEWGAVFDILGKDWNTLLLGIGWGNEFVPNYQPDPVRFTHSLFSFVLLKAGLVGLFLLVAGYAHLVGRFLLRLRSAVFDYSQLAIVLASVSVIVIGFTFQPTYKMLGFSVILAMLLTSPAGAPEGNAVGRTPADSL